MGGENIRSPRFSHVAQGSSRVGGENQLSETCIIVGVGSSPRGRGKPLVQARRIREEGLIPAWAGKT